MLTSLKEKLAGDLSPLLGLEVPKVMDLFEIPKDIAHGQLCVPVFTLAKEQKKAPPLIAKEIAEKFLTLNNPLVEGVLPVGGYVNFHLEPISLFTTIYNEVKEAPLTIGFSKRGRGQTVVIDYSSPNVAKPMHVGHLRATVIGQAIRNLAETQGYKVLGLNHLGDWGVQFGKLALAYKLWGSEYPFATEPFESLFQLYVRFHEEAEKNPDLEKEGSLTFKKLEEGDADLAKLWQSFVDISMQDFDKQWQRLGIHHDLVRGESFYNNKLKPTEELIQKKSLLVESEGAMVVDLSDEKMPPCLIRKSDGASLYATRDIASAIYRKEELHADLNLYVVGADQTLHFKQVFSVLKKMGYSWWSQCHHISFGMYRFKDVGKMSSRKGQIIRLDELLNRAIEIVKNIIKEKNPNLKNREHIAQQVAIGAIIFNDLVNDRVRDVEFDWDKALSFEGDSGPYLQYVFVRCSSILNKVNGVLPEKIGRLDSVEEKILIKILMQFEATLTASFTQFRPNILANYLLDVAAAFNRFYHNHKIIGGDESLLTSRIALVYVTQQVLRQGLKTLNIEAPAAM